tara:strand:- start:139 stop:318 length:180 start_codon:yes stop_codon:yes gene_type:complete
MCASFKGNGTAALSFKRNCDVGIASIAPPVMKVAGREKEEGSREILEEEGGGKTTKQQK